MALNRRRFELDVRRKLFTQEVVRNWKRWPREVNASSLKVFKAGWVEPWAIWWSGRCHWPQQGLGTRWCLKAPLVPNRFMSHSIIQ